MEDLQGNNLDEFYRNYRESLSMLNEANKRSLEQQRRNAQASIMGAANKAGMLFSNFGGRDKMKYDVQTYTPALVKAQQSYSTGLDTLRTNALKTINNIRSLQDQIAHLQSLGTNQS